MRTRMTQREFVGFWLALVTLAGVAGLAYVNIDAAGETLGWVEHANHVLRQLEEVSSTYSRATSARRAYIVAGDDSQLADKTDLDGRLSTALDALRTSVADNPAQVTRVEAYARLIDRRLAALDVEVERRRVTGSATEDREGLELAAKIRGAREEMETAENLQLSERDASTRRNMARTKLAEVVGTLTSFAILIFAFSRLRQEIVRRQRSEQAVRQGEAFLDSIVENIPDMVFVKDAAKLRFERVNRAGELLLGIDRKDLLRKTDFDFFPKEQAEAFQRLDRETLENRVAVDIAEERISTKTNETRWLHTRKVPILDEYGKPRYLLGISEDITRSREAARAIKEAKDAAEVANRELESFSYAVAHDLRAPLRALNGFSTALLEELGGKVEGEAKDHLERIGAAAIRMGQLIDALLGLSRVTRSELAREPVDLTEAASSVIAQIQAGEPEKRVRSTVEDGLSVEGDPHLIRVLLQNLLGNAWKFVSKREDPRIEFGRAKSDDGWSYFVRDNGAGFDMAYAGKLFVPFQRLHSTSEYAGTGIGLATVERIVRRHGGRIWAEGRVNEGATFHFTLGGG